ncbi:Wzz/FepE/Etk N-terminal domain-containing protein [Paraglaciecola chathamensis]|uniref:Lipopolysaccharide biosynthesis protein n=1 Tax=Paraglaciecola chathamensis S18K6 TaxID=1127672 RepID=A0AAV3V0I0_9ALTE|nr:Wzz/FepE/Etk N-terminal domain-containing protein [Paraglaciecola chathamensis]GAC10537.1 lipopolysaccharide biosynthesis protein [Paraglaciecola chathamensis S18K6]
MTYTKSNTPEKDKVQYVAISPDMFQAQNNDDEIDLRELWNVIWRGKWLIIAITTIFAVASVFYALSLPNIYRSEALLAPADSDQQGGLSGLSGQLGGLASLAGVNLGGGKTDKTALAIEILKSREFFAKFAEKHQILPDLVAAKGWDPVSNKTIYDEDIYSSKKGEWIRNVKPPKRPKPSMQEAKIYFDKAFKINKSIDTGMISIEVMHYSPSVAKQWVDWSIEDINLVMKKRDEDEARKSISYLESQLSKTNIVEQKALLYQLVEEQAKTLMFAEVRKEYIFKTIDKALVTEEKVSPNRAIIVSIVVIFAGILASVILLVRNYIKFK